MTTTLVHFDMAYRLPDTDTVVGTLTFSPALRDSEGGQLVIPSSTSVRYNGEPVDVQLEDLSAANAWEVHEDIGGVQHDRLIRPDPLVPNYADLPDIDSDTLGPVAELSPVYQAQLDALSADPALLDGSPVTVYGGSFVDPDNNVIAPVLYPHMFGDDLDAGDVTLYGVGGARINHVLGSLLSLGTWGGLQPPRAGALWPGVSARPGPVIVDCGTNDYSHDAGDSIPAPLVGAGGARYVAAIAAMYEAVLAMLSSETRHELAIGAPGVTTSGGWANAAAAYLSSGEFSYATAPGEWIQRGAVMPPQSGPLAGRVFAGLVQFEPSIIGNADVDRSVDGGVASRWVAPEYEQYGASTGGYAVVPVDLPVDGAAHDFRLTHAGANGEFLTIDTLFIPSEEPADVYVMQASDPVPSPTGYDAAHVAIWKANRDVIEPAVRAVFDEFSHALWTPTNMGPGDLWTDGIHLRAGGNRTRANDLIAARRLRALVGAMYGHLLR